MTDILKCYRCKEVKSILEFIRDAARKGGYRRLCRSCQRDYRNEHARKTVDRNARQDTLRKYRATHADKEKARAAVRNAVRDGRLIKPTSCQGCSLATSTDGLHGHHTDYSAALDVQWLCTDCHEKAHHAEPAMEKIAVARAEADRLTRENHDLRQAADEARAQLAQAQKELLRIRSVAALYNCVPRWDAQIRRNDELKKRLAQAERDKAAMREELDSYLARHAVPMTVTIGDYPEVASLLREAADKVRQAEQDRKESKRDIEKLLALQRERGPSLEFKKWVMLRGRPLPRTLHRHCCDICGFVWEHGRYHVQLMTKEGRTRTHICLNCGHLQREIDADRSDSTEQSPQAERALKAHGALVPSVGTGVLDGIMVPREGEAQPAKEEEFRAGLPAEALRAVHAEWDLDYGYVYIFEGNTYRGTHWDDLPAEEITERAEILHTSRFRPHGKTWSAVELKAAQKLGADHIGSAHCNDRGPMSLPALMKRLGYALPIEQETEHMQALYMAYRRAFDAAGAETLAAHRDAKPDNMPSVDELDAAFQEMGGASGGRPRNGTHGKPEKPEGT